jgi:serine/threonine protein phosphatase PrpC
MSAAEDCAACADERAAGASFCEACGNPLTTAAGTPAVEAVPTPSVSAGCPSCGAADAVGADGYCTQCGILALRPRDHIEVTVDGAGAVTDRGKRHHRNEDAVWIAARGAEKAVDLVVCDGVSSSFDPDVASATAAETAGRLLADADGAQAGAAEVEAALVTALIAAGADVAALAKAGDPRRATSNPACTIVAACVRGATVSVGWVGDSRAYWVPADGPAEQLTEDDSWAFHAISQGMDPKAAWSDRKAHAITAWLGADAGDVEPRTRSFVSDAAGHLLLCSDGLWNYLPEHAALADTVRAHLAAAADLAGAADLTGAARSLTAFANDCGGSDNITVALTRVCPAADGGDPAQ